MSQTVQRQTPRANFKHPLARGLIFCMPMIEDGGIPLLAGTVKDIISKQPITQNTATRVGAARNLFGWGWDFNGLGGGSVGTGNYLTIPRTNINYTDKFAVTMWYKPMNTPGGNVAFFDNMWGNNSAGGFQFIHNAGGSLSIHAGSTSGDNSFNTSTLFTVANFPNGCWITVTGSKILGTLRLYVNGKLDSSVTPGFGFVNGVTNTPYFWVGTNNGNSGGCDVCQIAHIMIHNRYLGAAEVAQLHANPFIVVREPLIYGRGLKSSGAAFTSTLTEVITDTDTFAKKITGKIFTDTETNIDTIIKQTQKPFLENRPMLDTVLAAKVALRTFTESFTNIDIISKQYQMIRAENQGYADVIQKQQARIFTDIVKTDLHATLSDDFNDNSIDTNKWTTTDSGYPSNVVEANSQIEISVNSGGINYNTLEGKILFDLTGASWEARLIDPGVQSTASNEAIIFIATASQNDKYYWAVNGNQIKAVVHESSAGGTYVVPYTLTYDSAAHKYFRLRESGGTFYWDFSADRITWTNAYSKSATFSVTSLLVAIQAGAYASETVTSLVKWDDCILWYPTGDFIIKQTNKSISDLFLPSDLPDSSILFDGQSSISAPPTSSLANGTVEFYMKRATVSAFEKIVFLNGAIDIGITNSNQLFGEIVGAANLGVISSSVTDNLPHHVAISWDGSFVRSYVDGVYQLRAAQAANQSAGTGSLFLGKRDTTEPYGGGMDGFRYSNIARYTTETSFIVSPDPYVSDANTLILFHFNEKRGTQAIDASSNASHGTLLGSPLPTWIPSFIFGGRGVVKQLQRSVTENQTYVDTITRVLSTGGKILTETMTFVDTRINMPIKTFLESVISTDTIRTIVQKLFTEATTFIDTVVKQTVKLFVENETNTASVIKQDQKSFSENEINTDTLVRQTQKTMLENQSFIDVLLRLPLKLLTEVQAMVDTIQKQTNKLWSEVVTHTDTVIKQTQRLFTETFTPLDTFIRIPAKILTEVQAFADVFTKLLNKMLVENRSFIDTIIKQTQRLFTENTTTTDTLTKQTQKLFTENQTYIDVLTKMIVKLFTEAVTYLDVLRKQTQRLFTETVTYLDTFLKLLMKLFIESVTYTNIFLTLPMKLFIEVQATIDTVQKSLLRSMTEIVTFSNVLIRQGVKAFAENEVYIDTITKQTQKPLSETTTLTAIFSRLSTAFRVLIESSPISDVLLTVKGGITTFSETIVLTDSIIKKTIKNLTEIIVASDIILRQLIKIFIENVTMLDIPIKQLLRSLFESVSLQDFLGKVTAKLFPEQVVVTATFSRQPIIGRIFNEAVSITATFARSLVKLFIEVISITAMLSGLLNSILSGIVHLVHDGFVSLMNVMPFGSTRNQRPGATTHDIKAGGTSREVKPIGITRDDGTKPKIR